MTTKKENQAGNVKRLAGAYNLLLNLFWSALSLIPLCVFCYERLETRLLLLFTGLSLLPAFLSRSAIDKLQLAKRARTYKKLGVALVQYVSQNGVFVNYLIRKRHPGHKVVSRKKNVMEALLKQTYVFEKFHLIGLVFFCLAGVYALYIGLVGWSLVLLLTNLVYNVYPILLQQYIRLKLSAYINKNKTHPPDADTYFTKNTLTCIR